MSKGGKRDNSGRKKIGVIVNTRIENYILQEIDNKIEGSSRAEKIRNCLKKGLENVDGKNSI
ncbi:MAG: hypothetical protein ACLVL6_06055 [Clostridium paraputrificum]|uniref:hypothetical protein n=1 Tax=Clostridium paraputrificum TaxID=29363 RepID=UPI000EA182DF|nr:hypothetical protein [Clostridium paraputrificum]RKI48036.1 hypothetical protein D7V67_08915 [Clostridium paraputrificum]